MQTESGAATIRRILAAYSIGGKIRELRLSRKLGLVELGHHCGLSASMLSQLENGRLTPTLPTLARISMVFDVGMDYFFSDRDRASVFHVVRASDRLRLPSNPNDTEPAWQFECLAFPAVDKEIQAYLALFEPRPHASAEHSHEGSELIFVLDGPLVITHVHRTVTLESGDSAWFDGRLLHGYQAPGPGQARAVVVTAPAAK